jgi:hypothetical protein
MPLFEPEQINRANQLIVLCKNFGVQIQGLTHKDQPVDGGRVLLTLAGLESNFGSLREFVRMESAYAPGGKYYNDDEELRRLFRRYGCLASSSFGTFQIMFKTAVELGYKDHPIKLQDDVICATWATELIVKRFIGRFRAKTLRDILDCYNSGFHGDKYIPTIYIEKGMEFYENLPWL